MLINVHDTSPFYGMRTSFKYVILEEKPGFPNFRRDVLQTYTCS